MTLLFADFLLCLSSQAPSLPGASSPLFPKLRGMQGPAQVPRLLLLSQFVFLQWAIPPGLCSEPHDCLLGSTPVSYPVCPLIQQVNDIICGHHVFPCSEPCSAFHGTWNNIQAPRRDLLDLEWPCLVISPTSQAIAHSPGLPSLQVLGPLLLFLKHQSFSQSWTFPNWLFPLPGRFSLTPLNG